MKISELIQKLEELKKDHEDIEVVYWCGDSSEDSDKIDSVFINQKNNHVVIA